MFYEGKYQYNDWKKKDKTIWAKYVIWRARHLRTWAYSGKGGARWHCTLFFPPTLSYCLDPIFSIDVLLIWKKFRRGCRVGCKGAAASTLKGLWKRGAKGMRALLKRRGNKKFRAPCARFRSSHPFWKIPKYAPENLSLCGVCKRPLCWCGPGPAC